MRIRTYGSIAFACLALLASGAWAKPYQLVVTISPPGSGNPSNDILRYAFPNTFQEPYSLANIPANLTNDPAHLAFRNPSELFVANRHGNGGAGSISRFNFSEDFLTVTPTSTLTGNGLANVHQICFNPVTGDLLAVNILTGGQISRFSFDQSGNAVPQGVLQTGLNDLRGVAIRPNGFEVFAFSYTEGLRRYDLGPGNLLTLRQTMFAAGNANGMHFGKFIGDELYVSQLYANIVLRMAFDTFGQLYVKQSISVPGGPIDIAPSPDGQELYISKHFSGGIDRFEHDPQTDVWNYTTTIPTTNLGGIATTYAPRYLGDIDNDGDVDIDDYDLLSASYGTFEGDPGFLAAADLDQDGDVDIDDYDLLAYNYGLGT